MLAGGAVDDTEDESSSEIHQPPSIAVPNLNKNSLSSIYNEKYTDADFEAELKEEEERERKAKESLLQAASGPGSRRKFTKKVTAATTIKERDVSLNEGTDGFVTQVNVDEVIKRSIKASQRNKPCNVKLLNPLQMIPSNIFQTRGRRRNARKPTASKSPDRGSAAMSPTYYYPMSSSKSKSFQGAATASSDTGRSARSNSTILPNINFQKNRFPNRGNLSSRRFYVRHVPPPPLPLSSLERRKELTPVLPSSRATPLKSSMSRTSRSMNQENDVKETTDTDDRSQSAAAAATAVINEEFPDENADLKRASRENTEPNMGVAVENRVEKQVFFDLAKASTPPPSQMESRVSKNSRQSLRSNSRQRKRAPITNPSSPVANRKTNPSNPNNLDYANTLASAPDVSNPSSSSKQSRRYVAPNSNRSVKDLQKLKNVDLNHFGVTSVLSSHYLCQSKRYLSDLNLHDVWPTSKMYKISIKANPWVNSFKEKLIANEINSNYFRSNTLGGGALSPEPPFGTHRAAGLSPSGPTNPFDPSSVNVVQPSKLESLRPTLPLSPHHIAAGKSDPQSFPAFQHHLHSHHQQHHQHQPQQHQPSQNSFNLFPKIKNVI